jgi:acetoin utilization protein AcuB
MKREAVVEDWMTPLPYTLAPTDSVEHATALLRQHGVRHLPVVSDGAVVGMLSERDLFVASRFANTHGMKVEVIMELEPYVVARSTPLHEVAQTMEAKRYGAAIVVDEGRLVGVFTAVDGLRALAAAR